MELPILTSRKGTKVIKATALHRALGLADHHYQANVRGWLKDIYQFRDGIRPPEGLKDYARSNKTAGKLVQEYYLNMEFARLVTLASKSRVKQPIATKLFKEEEVFPDKVQLSTEEMLDLIRQTRAMCRVSCQVAAEERHLKLYERRRGSADFWNRYRVDNLVYVTMEDLRKRLTEKEIGYPKGGRVRDLLLRYDALECIRVGIADHYAALGFPLPYACQLGQIAREMAHTMNLEVYDDRKGEDLFAPQGEADVVRQLRAA